MSKQKVTRKKKADPSKVKKKVKAGQIIKQKVVINVDKAIGSGSRGRARYGRDGGASKSGINKPQSIPTLSRFNLPNFIIPPGGGGKNYPPPPPPPPPNDDYIKKQLKLIQDGQNRIDEENKQNLLMIGQSQAESMRNLVGNINQQASKVFERLNKLESAKTKPPPQVQTAPLLNFLDDEEEQIAAAIAQNMPPEPEAVAGPPAPQPVVQMVAPPLKVGKKPKLSPEARRAVAVQNLQKAHEARRGGGKRR